MFRINSNSGASGFCGEFFFFLSTSQTKLVSKSDKWGVVGLSSCLVWSLSYNSIGCKSTHSIEVVLRDFCNRWTVVGFYHDVNFRDALGFVTCPTSLVCGRCGLQRRTRFSPTECHKTIV